MLSGLSWTFHSERVTLTGLGVVCVAGPPVAAGSPGDASRTERTSRPVLLSVRWTGCCGTVFMTYLRVRMSVRVLRYTGLDRAAIEVIPQAERSAEPGIGVAVGESSPDREPLPLVLPSRLASHRDRGGPNWTFRPERSTVAPLGAGFTGGRSKVFPAEEWSC